MKIKIHEVDRAKTDARLILVAVISKIEIACHSLGTPTNISKQSDARSEFSVFKRKIFNERGCLL